MKAAPSRGPLPILLTFRIAPHPRSRSPFLSVEDIILAIAYDSKAPDAAKAPKALISKAPEALESCDLPGQTSQTVETINGSPSSWGSRSRQWQ